VKLYGEGNGDIARFTAVDERIRSIATTGVETAAAA
jgi:hypothetical protein